MGRGFPESLGFGVRVSFYRGPGPGRPPPSRGEFYEWGRRPRVEGAFGWRVSGQLPLGEARTRVGAPA